MSWDDAVQQSFVERVEVKKDVLYGLFARVVSLTKRGCTFLFHSVASELQDNVKREEHTEYEIKVGVSEFPNAGEQRIPD